MAIFFREILGSLGIDAQVVKSANKLGLYLLPGLFLRCLTESFKGMLQSMGFIKQLGFCSLINILTSIPIGYFFIGFLGLNELGYGICSAIYYFNGCLYCLYFYLYAIPEGFRDTSIPIKDNFFWYFTESSKTCLANYYMQIIGLLIMITLAVSASTAEMGAYSIINLVCLLIPYLS